MTAPPAAAANERCASCGVWLAEDQEWCVDCGVARTMIRQAPDWRIGIAIVIGVVALIAVIVALAWP